MASHLEWKEAYSVGVEEFDEAHRDLIGQANALIEAIQTSAAYQDVREVLDNIIENTLCHFEEEEQLMQQMDYPGLPAHRADHDLLLRTFLKFRADIRYKRLHGEEAAEFLIDWVLRHVKDYDIQYKGFFLAKGIR